METITIKRKLVEDALDQLKAAQQDSYVQSTQNVIDDLEVALREPPVIKSVCPLCDGKGRRVFPNCTPPIDEVCPVCKGQTVC